MHKASVPQRVYLNINAIFCFLLIYLPILTLIVFSFNASSGTLAWSGFTLKWFEKIFSNTAIQTAIWRSLEVATWSSLLATVLGVMMAMGLRKLPTKVSRKYEVFLTLPILVPEIVTAVGLLMTFAKIYRPAFDFLGLGHSSMTSIVAGHMSIALAYVVVIVKARLSHLDPTLELVAKNLGATKTQTFFSVILPQIWPSILCAYLLVFTNSLDDFYISHFLTLGGSGYTTLPVYLFGLQSRSGLTPEMNAIGSLMMLVSIGLIGLTVVLSGNLIKKEPRTRAKKIST